MCLTPGAYPSNQFSDSGCLPSGCEGALHGCQTVDVIVAFMREYLKHFNGDSICGSDSSAGTSGSGMSANMTSTGIKCWSCIIEMRGNRIGGQRPLSQQVSRHC